MQYKMWQAVLTSIYTNNFDVLEPVLAKHYNVARDHPRDAAEALAVAIGDRLRGGNMSNITEVIRFYLSSPYVERQTFAEWTAREVLKNPNWEDRFFDLVEPYCDLKKIRHMREALNAPVRGFKLMNRNLQSGNFQYVEGETHELEGVLQVCYSGFHFWKRLCDVPAKSKKDDVIVSVEATGDVQRDNAKYATDKIRIVARVA